MADELVVPPAPAPIPMDRLTSMLAGARKVMVESDQIPNGGGGMGAPSNQMRGNALPPRSEMIGEEIGMESLLSEGQMRQRNPHAAPQQHGYNPYGTQEVAPTVEAPLDVNGFKANLGFANSNMAPEVLQAMRETPIPQIPLNQTFDISQVPQAMVNQAPAPILERQDLGAPAPAPQQYTNQAPAQPRNDMMTVSETVLRGIVKEILLEFMTDNYAKSLREDVVKSTVQALAKNGMLNKKPQQARPPKQKIGQAIQGQ